MKPTLSKLTLVKPLLRGHFHQAAFFVALGATLMLAAKAKSSLELIVTIVYSLSLLGLFGVSAIYHRVQWQPSARAWMRRLDHSAIFLLIAGTVTPIAVLAVGGDAGCKLLYLVWLAAGLGVVQSLVWVHAPKWLTAILYLAVGWLAIPFLPQIGSSVGPSGVAWLLAGGVLYSIGAIVYALKRPNPLPLIFGYHEIFHVLVILAAICHFIVVYQLLR